MMRRLTVGGSATAIGRATGTAVGPRLKHFLRSLPAVYLRKGLHWPMLVSVAETFLPVVRRLAPSLLTEIRALAGAAGVSFRDAFFLFVEEETMSTFDASEHCSNAVVVDPRHGTLLIHNEDYASFFGRSQFLRLVKEKNGAYVQYQYFAGFPGCTVLVNDRGLAWAENSLDVGVRSGVPKNVLLWLIRHAATPEKIVATFRRYRPASCFGLAVTSAVGQALIEVMFSGVRIRHVGKSFCQTNQTQLGNEKLGSISSRSRLRFLRLALRRQDADHVFVRMSALHGGIRVPVRADTFNEATLATVIADAQRGQIRAVSWIGGRARHTTLRLEN